MQDSQDFLHAKGSVEITKIDSQGKVEKRLIPNLVVALGKEYIADRMSSNSASIMKAIAVGTGNTAVVYNQTSLQGTELARQATTTVGGNRTGNTIVYSTTFSAGTGTGAISEAGVFSNTTINGVGTMLCRTKFDVVNKAAGDTLEINWTVQIT